MVSGGSVEAGGRLDLIMKVSGEELIGRELMSAFQWNTIIDLTSRKEGRV